MFVCDHKFTHLRRPKRRIRSQIMRLPIVRAINASFNNILQGSPLISIDNSNKIDISMVSLRTISNFCLSG